MNTNEKKEITIRIAKEEDAEELLAIYAPYIEHTVITYEYDVPTSYFLKILYFLRKRNEHQM